ncbi:MAG: SGNH/GDSL hydrolase family protein [Myxococcota bacterium]
MRRLAFALVVLAVAAALAEGAARAWGPGLLPPDRSREARPGEPTPGEPNMVGDAATGWRARTGPQQSFGIPGGTFVNSLGARGPELPLEKARKRVLFLGDSTVFGVFVADRDTFAQRVGEALDVEVINGGCPGWSSWQALRAVEARLGAYRPDLVVIATLWSDAQGADTPDAVRFGGARASWIERSHGFVLLREWVRAARWGSRAEEVRVGLQMPVAPTLRVPLADYDDNLRALARTAPAAAFLVLPSVRDPANGKVGDFRDAYREVMREVAAELGAPLADAPSAFVGTDARAMFHDEVHPTVAGHARIAAVLTDVLRDR